MPDKISETIEEYRKTHATSEKLWKRAKRVFPGGVSHNIRRWGLPKLGAYPFFINKADGCKIWDVDNNEYIDFWIGHMELLFGHTPKQVINAVRKQALQGLHWGILNRKAVKLAEIIRESVPSIEKLRFANSGTEATMNAVRLARGYTEKDKILKMRSGWHGANSELLHSIYFPFDEKESSGLLPCNAENCISLHFNNQEKTKETIQRHRGDIAGLIIEPVLGAGGGIPANTDYLQLLRDEAEEKNFCLIFDEVITGFRLGLGGAQEYYNVIPDLTVLGKTVGGGLPIGVVGGKREILELANPTRERSEHVLMGGGTFSMNPMTMTAALATLKKIQNEEENLYRKLNELGKYVRRKLRRILQDFAHPTKVVGTHSLGMVHFLTEEIADVTPTNLQEFQAEKKAVEFRLRLLNRGFFQYHGLGALCTEHHKEHLDRYLRAVEKTLQNMK